MFSQKNQIESNSAILRYINADSAGTVPGGRQTYLPRFMAAGQVGRDFSAASSIDVGPVI